MHGPNLSLALPVFSPSALMNASARNLLLLCLLSVLWGSSYALIRVAVATIPPITLAAARTAMAAALLWAVVLAQGDALPRERRTWRRFGVQALLNSVVPFTLIAWAERWVPSGLAAILNSTSPIFVLLCTGLVTRHESVGLRKIFGAGLGILGVCLVVGERATDASAGNLVPELAVVLASVSYGMAYIYGRRFDGVKPPVTAAGTMTCATVLLTPASLLFDRPWTLPITTASLLALVALGVLSTALAFVVYFQLIQTMGSVGTASQAFLRVPVSVGLGVVLLGESLTTRNWLGLIGVVFGVAAITLPSWPWRATPPSAICGRT